MSEAAKSDSKTESAYKSISVVAEVLGIEPHVLRFWETKFPEIVPFKHTGGRRLYREEDIILIKGIHHLLHTQGLTIKGARKVITKHGLGYIKSLGEGNAPDSFTTERTPSTTDRKTLEEIREKLIQALDLLK